LVDEHQDSNVVQNELLKLWQKNNNVFAVSDPKQNLYSFRGSDTRFSMNFEDYWDGAKVINVDTNYRSKRNIIEKSNDFIRKYYGGYEHYSDSIAHDKSDGHIEINSYMNQQLEATDVADKIEKLIEGGTKLKDIAVLYRNNKHADFIEYELKKRDIDYEIANDGSFFKRREIAGILSLIRLGLDDTDNNAFENVFRLRTYPLKYFSNQLYNNIRDTANKHGYTLLEALYNAKYPQM